MPNERYCDICLTVSYFNIYLFIFLLKKVDVLSMRLCMYNGMAASARPDSATLTIILNLLYRYTFKIKHNIRQLQLGTLNLIPTQFFIWKFYQDNATYITRRYVKNLINTTPIWERFIIKLINVLRVYSVQHRFHNSTLYNVLLLHKISKHLDCWKSSHLQNML